MLYSAHLMEKTIKTLLVRIFLNTGQISLMVTPEKREEVANYLSQGMLNKSMCTFRDGSGIINAVCRGENILGYSFEESGLNLQNKYLSAATKHFEMATRHLEDTMQGDSWKFNSEDK